MNQQRLRILHITILMLVAPMAYADSLIRIKCTVDPDWINKFIEAGTKTPKLTREDAIEYLQNGKIYEIEASFTDDKELVGRGTFLGQEVGYFAAGDSGIIFLLPGETGSDKIPTATLDRIKGRMYLQYPDLPAVEYVCNKLERKF
jgi:hypothetical protein